MASAREINILVRAKDQASGVLGGISGKLKGLAGAGVKAAAAGIAGLGAGLLAAGGAGLKFNSDMENVQAQLMGFVKDGDKVNQMLANLRSEAATTPFSFGEMAEAMVSLTPAARQSGMDVMALIEQAEILAALNPAEGMVGGAFALKEALSGDFTSIVERFNLPRQRLNELKDQGVPAVEAVSTVLNEMGADISLVDNLSKTLTGRWSTVQDTLMGLAATATKPIFDQLSAGLGTLGDFLSQNEPRITAFAETLGTRIGDAATQASGFITSTVIPALKQIGEFITGTAIPALQRFADWFSVNGMPVIQSFAELVKTVFGGIASFLREHGDTIKSILQGAWDTIKGVVEGALHIIEGIIKTVTAVMKGDWQGAWDGIKEIVSGAKGVIVSLVTGLKDAIIGIFKGAGAWLWNAGKDLIQGLINGIAGMWGAVVGTARRLADTVVSTIKGALQIHSPSEVLREIGQFIVAGLTGGMDDKMGEAAKKAAEVANAVVDSLSNALDFATKAGKAGSLPSGINELISSLKFMAEHAVQSLGDTGRYIGTELLDAAKGAGDSVNSVMGALGATLTLITDGAEAFDKGIDTGDGKWREMASSLKFLAEHAAQSLADTARYLGTETLDAAKQAGEAMGAPFGVLTAALDFVDRAAESVSLKAGITFGEPLIQTLVGIATMATQAMSEAAARFETDVLEATSQAAESMGKPFGVLTDALGFADDVIGFLADNKWPNVSSQLIELLTDLAVRSVQAFSEAATRFSTDVLESASAFADAAGPVFDTIKKVADGFTALQEMGKVSEDKLGLFEGNIQRVMGLVRRMRSMAESGITDATVFRNLMDQIAAALKVGTETLGGAQAKAGGSNTVTLTPMAHGGIVTRPTPILAGEAGPEAIIPLNRAGRNVGRPVDGLEEREIHVHLEVGGREFKELILSVLGSEIMFQGARYGR